MRCEVGVNIRKNSKVEYYDDLIIWSYYSHKSEIQDILNKARSDILKIISRDLVSSNPKIKIGVVREEHMTESV